MSNRIWLIGDDVWTPATPNDALRYMNNPTQDGSSLDYYPDYTAGTGVHYSSGIPNLAFYLLSQGGTHPRARTTQVVTGIGIERAARIFYKANVDLLLPSSTMEQAKVATEQAAAQLGYDAATITQVSNAWRAVGVGVPVPPPPTTPLVKDVVVTGLSDARGAKKYFSINVPEGASDLQFKLAGGTGDADLYVRVNQAPTTSTYDCRPYLGGNNETCTIAAPAQGTWYVMLNAFSAYANTTLVATWKGGYEPITSGVPVKPLSGVAGSSRVYTITVPEYPAGSGTNSLYVQTGQGYGNPDIYVRRAGVPTKFDYDCRSAEEHMSEECALVNVPAGKYYIELYGAKGGYEDIALIASFEQEW
jgi:vibriolysin